MPDHMEDEEVGLNRLSLRLLYRCLECWGPIRGGRVWWALHRTIRGRADGNVLKVTVPGYAHPVWLRPGTSDIASFERIFLKNALDGREFAQQGVVDARAAALGRKAVIIDGGANIGLSAVWFARAYPQATIFAVEPDAGNVAMLRRNTAAYPNVVPVEGGLWDKPATLGIVNPGDTAWAYRVDETRHDLSQVAIAALSINELMARAGADELMIVKLIIQGAEKAVFRSNLDWLARTRQVIFMPNDWAEPWSGAGRVAMAALARLSFDWIVKDLCVFCYRDPASMVSTGTRNIGISAGP